ncbi:MAG: Abi-alpha family protein [Panacagrimonas sp.]
MSEAEEPETDNPSAPTGAGGTASESDATSLLGQLASGAWKLAYRGPRKALHLAHRGVSEAEKLALSTLRRRMDEVADEEESPTHRHESASVAPVRQTPAARAQAPKTAIEVVAQLLEDSLEQSSESAHQRLLLRIAQQLVPDEARILAALADGHHAALMHVAAGPRVGPANQRWLENLSPVGREAGVMLPEQTSTYITHLRALGLLESGDEDKAMQLKYQLLEADTRVRKTCDEIEKNGLRSKLFRRTVRMSEAGKAFWAACEPKDKASW